ncbi:hypothetical protein [Burkholderia latens]|uniref:hypothetical protein n=1 Tax=Burkholderia latens TaxID=488446 RepID=UPI00158BD430|nr:hypothetical protein [Burkholderia latens]
MRRFVGAAHRTIRRRSRYRWRRVPFESNHPSNRNDFYLEITEYFRTITNYELTDTDLYPPTPDVEPAGADIRESAILKRPAAAINTHFHKNHSPKRVVQTFQIDG